MKIAVLAGWGAFFIATAVQAQSSSFDRYERREFDWIATHIQDIYKDAIEGLPAGKTLQIDPEAHPLLVRVHYTGNWRPLPDQRRQVIATVLHDRPEFVAMYTEEVEIRIGDGRTFWLPIQNTLTQAMRTEVPVDGAIDAYVTVLGGVDGEPVATINAFDGPISTDAVELGH